MKNLKITIGALLLTMSVNFSMAQDIKQKATSQTESMTTQLGLTAEQKAKVSELNFGIFDKNEAISKDANMSQEVKNESTKSNNEARIEILRQILTAEQHEMYVKSLSKSNASNKNTVKEAKATKMVKQEVGKFFQLHLI